MTRFLFSLQRNTRRAMKTPSLSLQAKGVMCRR